jgi:ribosomal protein L7/L12
MTETWQRRDRTRLTVGYRPDVNGEILAIAASIRTRLGQPATGASLDSLQRLVDAGQTIEAIKRVREDEGLSLSEAKRGVDALTKKES